MNVDVDVNVISVEMCVQKEKKQAAGWSDLKVC